MEATPATEPNRWPADILYDYLDGVDATQVIVVEEEEAMSTDGEDNLSETSEAPTLDSLEDYSPQDIESDDSAFSSDDEYATAEHRETQRATRRLVLGKPTIESRQKTRAQLAVMQEDYMKQLDDADAELAEITGQQHVAVVRKQPDEEGMVTTVEDDMGGVRELRMRPTKEVVAEDRQTSLTHLVLLAQELFRKEREVKRIRKARGGMHMDNEGGEWILLDE
jgi:hypothetical protein